MRARARTLAFAALTAAGALLLAGCSGAAEAQSSAAPAAGSLPTLSPDEQVDISFESYNLAQAGLWTDAINSLIAEFEKQHPNIHVEGRPADISSGGTTSGVQKELLAGDPPDVAQIVFNELPYAVTQLQAANLSQLVGQEGLDEAFGGQYPFNKNARVLADLDGSTYGLPYVFSTPVLWVNESLLQQAGIDPATVDLSTWDKVAEASKKVSAVTGSPALSVTCVVTGGNWCMQSLFKSNGAQVLSDDRSTIEFGSDAAVDTVQSFTELYKQGVLANEDTQTQVANFSSGKEAFHVNTSVYQSTFINAAKNGGWTLNAHGLPAFGSKPVVPVNSGSALMMFSQDPKKQAAAWELMKFFTSPTAYETITTKIGYLPLRDTMTAPGGPLADWLAANPLAKPNLEQLQTLSPWVAYPGNSFLQVDQVLYAAIEDSIFNGKDPKATLQSAASRAQELIQQ